MRHPILFMVPAFVVPVLIWLLSLAYRRGAFSKIAEDWRARFDPSGLEIPGLA